MNVYLCGKCTSITPMGFMKLHYIVLHIVAPRGAAAPGSQTHTAGWVCLSCMQSSSTSSAAHQLLWLWLSSVLQEDAHGLPGSSRHPPRRLGDGPRRQRQMH
eukprot:COSAG01_NODE_21399_length_904_cov_0.714286_1_plen_102_part_00